MYISYLLHHFQDTYFEIEFLDSVLLSQVISKISYRVTSFPRYILLKLSFLILVLAILQSQVISKILETPSAKL